MEFKKEKWKVFQCDYEISNYGRMRRKKGDKYLYVIPFEDSYIIIKNKKRTKQKIEFLVHSFFRRIPQEINEEHIKTIQKISREENQKNFPKPKPQKKKYNVYAPELRTCAAKGCDKQIVNYKCDECWAKERKEMEESCLYFHDPESEYSCHLPFK